VTATSPSKVANPNHPAGPPPREAIDYLRRKRVRTGFSYEDVWAQEHSMAFTVAKMMDVDLLRDVQRSLITAQQQGKPFEQWRKEMEGVMAKRGWWGEKEVIDPKTGKTVKAQLGSSRRLETIWRVNMGQASQAGIWERGSRSSSHPYILYRLGPSQVHREQHERWNGLLLPKEDPFWKTAFPRNGWGCKCTTRFVSRAQAERYRRKGLPGGGKPQEKAPALKRMTYTNTRTGEVRQGFEGIDPGFEYNPGEGREQQLRTAFRERDAIFAGTVEPNPNSTDVGSALDVPTDPKQMRSDLRRGANEAIRAVRRVHGVGAGKLPTIPVVQINDPRVYGRYWWDKAGNADRIELSKVDPDWPAMTAAHEIGHFLDHSGLSKKGVTDKDDLESKKQSTPTMREVMKAIRQSKRYALLQGNSYLTHEAELWARAYAQYIAWRSGSSVLKAQLDKMLTHKEQGVRVRQWPYDEFVPIAQAIDKLLMSRRWASRKKKPTKPKP